MASTNTARATLPDDFIIEDGDVVVSPIRNPINASKDEKGSVHDDTTAQRLGFRGGTVAGSLHMDQFPPLMLHVFGDKWFESGNLSLYFRFATIDGEGVRCFANQPKERRQTSVWMERDDGKLVLSGTAACGVPDMSSALRSRIEQSQGRTRGGSEQRILRDVHVGNVSGDCNVQFDVSRLKETLPNIVEPLPQYGAEADSIAPPSETVHLMRAVENELVHRSSSFGVGLFGAIELQYLNGPVRVHEDYVTNGRVLAVGETNQTEYFWYESTLSSATSHEATARMLMMLRFMKSSSPLWQS